MNSFIGKLSLASLLFTQSFLIRAQYTDTEQRLIQSYYHPEWEKNQFDKICEEANANQPENVNGMPPNPMLIASTMDFCKDKTEIVFSDMADTLITRAVSMITAFAFMGKFLSSSISQTVIEGGGLNGKSAKEVTTLGNDSLANKVNTYCPLPAVTGEMLAFFTQTHAQTLMQSYNDEMDKAEAKKEGEAGANSHRDRQIESFAQMIKAYETRRIGAYMQASGWGLTGLCYAASEPLLFYRNKGSKTLFQNTRDAAIAVSKTAAATFLTWFYITKAQKGELANKKLEEIKTKLQGLHNCNPVTQRVCYCSEMQTTAYDPKYCNPQLFSPVITDTRPVSCIKYDQTPDPKCECNLTNTCLEQKFNQFPVQLKLPGSSISDVGLVAVKNLTKGKANTATLSGVANNSLGALKNHLRRNAPPMTVQSMNNAQKAAAQDFLQAGLPANWANFMAALPENDTQKAALAQFKSGESIMKNAFGDYKIEATDWGEYNGSSKRGGRVLQFTSNSSGGSSYLNSKKNDKNGNPYGAKNAQMRKVAGGTLDFGKMESATSKAQINSFTTKSLFELISYRYQNSTWKLFSIIED